MSDLVSVIMPAYNSSEYISDAIESVLAQNYQEFELIIVDDCSSDNTLHIVNQFADKDDRVRLYELDKNSGAAIARNLAIEKANGRYIAFLDSDDMWKSDKLVKQIAFMKKTTSALSYTAYEKIAQDGERENRIVWVPEKIDYNNLLNASVIGCLTAIYDTSITGKVYLPDIRRRQDYGLWLKILKRGSVAYGLNEPLAFLRKRKGSLSSNKFMAAWYVWRLYREHEELSYFNAIYHFVNYAVRASLKARI